MRGSVDRGHNFLMAPAFLLMMARQHGALKHVPGLRMMAQSSVDKTASLHKESPGMPAMSRTAKLHQRAKLIQRDSRTRAWMISAASAIATTAIATWAIAFA